MFGGMFATELVVRLFLLCSSPVSDILHHHHLLQETIFPVQGPELFYSNHTEDRVPLAAVISKCIVQHGARLLPQPNGKQLASNGTSCAGCAQHLPAFSCTFKYDHVNMTLAAADENTC